MIFQPHYSRLTAHRSVFRLPHSLFPFVVIFSLPTPCHDPPSSLSTPPYATLSTAGGKAQNLAKLARAGLPVPPGFIVTTAAYQSFVAANDLQPFINVSIVN